MSLVLHEEISQTLLGIHVRLLTLKREAAVRHVGFPQEIATTQRLVEESVKSIHSFAREFDIPMKPRQPELSQLAAWQKSPHQPFPLIP